MGQGKTKALPKQVRRTQPPFLLPTASNIGPTGLLLRNYFLAWRQILTRAFLFGTVGQVMGSTFSPSALKRAAKGRGYIVIKGTIGVGSCRGDNDNDADGWRCAGSDRISGMIGVDEW